MNFTRLKLFLIWGVTPTTRLRYEHGNQTNQLLSRKAVNNRNYRKCSEHPELPSQERDPNTSHMRHTLMKITFVTKDRVKVL